MRIESSILVTPSAVISPVNTVGSTRSARNSGGQVVDLGGSIVTKDVDQRDLVDEVTRDERDLILMWLIRSIVSVELRRMRPMTRSPSRAAVRQIGAVLTGDPVNKRSFGHRQSSEKRHRPAVRTENTP